MVALLLLAAPVVQAGPLSEAFVATSAPETSEEHVRIVFIGDSGYVPDGESCVWQADGTVVENCHILAEEQARLRSAIQAAEPHAIYGLGDLVYPDGPSCRTPGEGERAVYDASIGDVYGGLGAPSWLVLGNHDVGHTKSKDARVRCLSAWASGVEGIELPAAQYTVDHGLVQVVVPNSSLRDQDTWPREALVDAVESGDWVILAAHHELRTAFEKMGQGPWEPAGSGEWLSSLGVVPHLYANGHAHALQLGAFDARLTDDGVVDLDDPATPLQTLALTSGAASKLRANPSCSPDTQDACDVLDARGLPAYASSQWGFAVVDVEPELMTVELRDLDGELLISWSRTKEDVGPVDRSVAQARVESDPMGTDFPGPRWCEASALGLGGEGQILVGDNERREGLLGATLQDDDVLFADSALPFLRLTEGKKGPEAKDWTVKDIESMAAWKDSLLVVGSHSRKGLKDRDGVTSCPRDGKRRRVVLVEADDDLHNVLIDDRWEREDDDWDEAMSSTDACVDALFDDLVDASVDDAEAFCEVLVDIEARAEDNDPWACANSLNIEGAVTVDGRVWLGLRGPELDGMAVMLRLEDGWEDAKRKDGVSFDALAKVDIGGLVIRGLDLDDDRLIGTAHLVGDDPEAKPFTLWTADTAELEPGATLTSSTHGTVPTSSEGVLVVEQGLLLVQDGDQGVDTATCVQPSGSVVVPLP